MAVKVSSLDQLELLMHGVQATRRHVERLACPIQGASGVRAQFYPHQLQNVQRILSASRIRHLIADEVGMGKTIQALMVANALRLQKEKLRVRILVGSSELQSQWIKEIRVRAHATAEVGHTPTGTDWFQVVSESEITSLAQTLASDQFDLLVLDEPQSLRADLLGYIAEHSDSYSRLLLLTASPNLRDVRRLCELLQMLEPERIERVRRELESDVTHEDDAWCQSRLRDSNLNLLEQLHNRFIENYQNPCLEQMHSAVSPEGSSEFAQELSDPQRARIWAESRWMYRNVLRSFREDFPEHLPKRRVKQIVVEPTEGERQRMKLAKSCIAEFSQPTNAAEFLRRVSLGGNSLLARVRERRTGEQELESRLVSIGELSKKSVADARLDALVDWLSTFWRIDPRRKVVIAAQDNPTVDELANELKWRIPEIGPRDARIKLRILPARDERELVNLMDEEGVEVSAPLTALMTSQLREFEEADTQLLIAHDAFRQSYNLQAADALVLYSLPWRPEALDQWIGRVDRLGRDFVDPEKRLSPPKPIRILTLHRKGDPTEQLEAIWHRYQIFESALDPDRGLLQRITDDIHHEVLCWCAPEDESAGQLVSRATNSERRKERHETRPPNGSPWTVENAILLFTDFLNGEVAEPALRHTKPLGFVSSHEEFGLASWMRLLVKHRLINLSYHNSQQQSGKNRRSKFYTLSQGSSVRVKVESLEDRASSHPAFFIARRNIQRPPRLMVETGTKSTGQPWETVLQFLSHGAPLHEELVRTFMEAGRPATPLSIEIHSLGKRYYPQGTELCPGEYWCGVGFVDSATVYQNFECEPAFFRDLSSDIGARQQEMRAIELEKLRAGVEADARFIRILAPTILSNLAWLHEENQYKSCSPQQAADLLCAHWSSKARPNSTRLPLKEPFQKWAAEKFPHMIAQASKKCWLSSLESIRERLEERMEVLRIEAEDGLWNLHAAIEETSQRIGTGSSG